MGPSQLHVAGRDRNIAARDDSRDAMCRVPQIARRDFKIAGRDGPLRLVARDVSLLQIAGV